MAEFAIRVSSVQELFDPFSAEPLEWRPLRDAVRERLLDAWIDTWEDRPESLTVQVPSGDRSDGLGPRLQAAIRHDLETTYETSRRFDVFTRSERRQAQIAFLFLVACQLAASLVDRVTGSEAFFDSLAQGLVVLGWVALWGPAQQVFRAVSRRLASKRYRELAQVEIYVEWA